MFKRCTVEVAMAFFLHVVAINVGMYNQGIIVAEKRALLQGAHSVICGSRYMYIFQLLFTCRFCIKIKPLNRCTKTATFEDKSILHGGFTC
jgi:hypothetical protein